MKRRETGGSKGVPDSSETARDVMARLHGARAVKAPKRGHENEIRELGIRSVMKRLVEDFGCTSPSRSGADREILKSRSSDGRALIVIVDVVEHPTPHSIICDLTVRAYQHEAERLNGELQIAQVTVLPQHSCTCLVELLTLSEYQRFVKDSML